MEMLQYIHLDMLVMSLIVSVAVVAVYHKKFRK